MTVYGPFYEGTTVVFAGGQLADQDDANVAKTSLDTLTVTLSDWARQTIINGRNRQNILDTNGGTVSNTGLVTWTLTPSDMCIVGTTIQPDNLELHRIRFDWTWDSKTGACEHQVLVRKNVVPTDVNSA